MSTIINGIGRVGIRIAPPSGGGYTTRTTAFAAATGIVDTTILNALNTFDTGLISNGLASKMKALYPFVGGTATTHKYNFMDARDLDIAFRLSFSGGFTHSSTGVLPNGTNAYANTYFNPKSIGSNQSMGVYVRTNPNSSSAEIGCIDGDNNGHKYHFIHTNVSGNTYWLNNTSQNSSQYLFQPTISVPNGAFFQSNRIGETIYGYRNTTTYTKPSTYTPIDLNAYIFARNVINGGVSLYSFSAKEQSFAYFGLGMSDNDMLNLYTLTQALQTSLSRQV